MMKLAFAIGIHVEKLGWLNERMRLVMLIMLTIIAFLKVVIDLLK
jgi:hypothetical protein